MVVLCLIGAAAAARRIVALETAPLAGASPLAGLDRQFAAKAGMTLLHIVPSLLFVLLIPLQFVSDAAAPSSARPSLDRSRDRSPGSRDRYFSAAAERSPGGRPGRSVGHHALRLLFSAFSRKAWWHIRNRRVELHREWATRMVAIALGVATTRPVMAVFFATSRLTGLTPQQFFGPAMWIGFVTTYLAAEAWIRHSRAGVSYCAVQPPSIVITEPVTNSASVEHR